MHIYLAGKIVKGCWRHSVVKDLRGAWEAGSSCPTGTDRADMINAAEWPVLRRAIFGRHHYVGPYFASCDHGCWHREDAHAVVANLLDDEYFDLRGEAEARNDVVSRCLRALGRADLVFAWVDQLDCYGTVAEVGYAAALGKTICIAGPRYFRDMWFLYHLASPPFLPTESPWRPSKSAEDALRGCLERLEAAS